MSVKWEVQGPEFANCNCVYACPCQFNSLPTDNVCKALGMMRIEKGRFGDINLDGLHMGFMIDFPNPIHEGNGTHQAILDERADEAQRDAMLTIVRGDETDEAATHWYIYSKMSSTHLEPLIAPIHFDIDIDNRTSTTKVGDVIDATCQAYRLQALDERLVPGLAAEIIQSEETSKWVRKNASGAALPAIYWAIMAPATRVATSSVRSKMGGMSP